MAIEQIYHLNRDGVSLVLETTAGTPNILHWGLQFPQISNQADLLSALDEPSPHGYFDEAHRGGVWRENARGFLGRPSLLGHRNGSAHSQLFTLREVKTSEHQVTFVSVDANAELEVEISYELTPSGVVLVRHKVTNLGLTEFTVDSTVAFMALPDHAAEIIDFSGRWLKERVPQRQEIQTGSWVREGREGRSGHDYTIIQMAVSRGASFQNGEAWGVSLAWSGNPRHIVERTMVGRTQIGAGELLLPGEVVLAQGETYEAPLVVATYSNAGIDGVSDRLHRWIRARHNHPT
ncbi:MAG: alpha-galactosidase, partial [Actinobacteria bacterium]|nr:alpha-galactosidase [Actinomycetota bacterium]